MQFKIKTLWKEIRRIEEEKEIKCQDYQEGKTKNDL